MKNSIALPLLADRVLNTPLLITADKLNAIMDVLGPRIGLGGQPVTINMANQKPAATISQIDVGGFGASGFGGEAVNLALITVHGTLVNRSGGMEGWSGIRSYEAIRKDIRAAEEDFRKGLIQGIVFDYNSGGGEACGCFDLVDDMYALRGQIPTYALINEAACSGAYGCASAQDEIYVTRTAGVGSVGVRMKHVDRSKKNEEEGYTVTDLAIGERKLDGNPDQPLSAGAKLVFTAEMEKVMDLFVATVARNRGMDEKAVRALEAAVLTGEDAVKAGLADAVLSYEAALQRAADNIATGGFSMSNNALQKQLSALLKGSDEQTNIEALAGLGFVPQASALSQADVDKAVEAATAKVTATARAAALDYAGKVIGLCGLAGLPAMAGGFISAGTSEEEVQAKLVSAKAAGAKEQEISSTVSALTTGAVNPLIADARQRADAAAKK